MIKWNELKVESKLSFLALAFSLVVLGINETRYYYNEQAEEESATIKLNLIDLFASNNNLNRSNIILKYMTEHDDLVEKRKLSQSLYELMKDGVVVYTKSTDTYELVSFTSIYENKGHTLSTVKNNVTKLLKKKDALNESEIIYAYEGQFGYALSQEQLSYALYEALKDRVIVYNVTNQLYQMASYGLMYKDNAKPIKKD